MSRRRRFGPAAMPLVAAIAAAAGLLPARTARCEPRPELSAGPVAGALVGAPATVYGAGGGVRAGIELAPRRGVRPLASLTLAVYPGDGARLTAGYLWLGAAYGHRVYGWAGLGLGVVHDQLRLRLDDRSIDDAETALGLPVAVGVGWRATQRIELGLSYAHVFLIQGSSSWIGHPLASLAYRF